MVHLAAFVSAPLFAKIGPVVRPKRLINFGSFLQGAAGFFFGFLEYVQNTGAFLGLSYFLR